MSETVSMYLNIADKAELIMFEGEFANFPGTHCITLDPSTIAWLFERKS